MYIHVGLHVHVYLVPVHVHVAVHLHCTRVHVRICIARNTLDPYNIANIRVLGDGAQLEISDARVDDAAAYTCIASNAAGRADRKFQLSVLGQSRVAYVRTYMYVHVYKYIAVVTSWYLLSPPRTPIFCL